jgi:phenylpropionate dioxygenase-like ring-hydroxylating dioxygenase large terminal subunit
VDSYPVEERYGVVFAFLGDLPEEGRPPVCPVPECGQEGWRAGEIAVLDINCYYERSMENGLDPVHNEFVHPGQGFPPMLPETFRAIASAWGSGFEACFGDPQLEMTTFARERNRTRIYFLNMRNCMLEESMDQTVMDISLKIAHEDIRILEALNPIRTPATLTREIMTPGDHTVIRFRERLREWDSRGWRIDRHALKAATGDVAYAIPCPARREAGHWVLEPVPLIPARE